MYLCQSCSISPQSQTLRHYIVTTIRTSDVNMTMLTLSWCYLHAKLGGGVRTSERHSRFSSSHLIWNSVCKFHRTLAWLRYQFTFCLDSELQSYSTRRIKAWSNQLPHYSKNFVCSKILFGTELWSRCQNKMQSRECLLILLCWVPFPLKFTKFGFVWNGNVQLNLSIRNLVYWRHKSFAPRDLQLSLN